MPVRQSITGTGVPVRIYTDDIDAAARRQLEQVATLPFVYPHVVAMPDVHVGVGASVGSVIPTRAAIIPAAVGVDIGCGMNAVRLRLDAASLPDDAGRLRRAIEAIVPVGFESHSEPSVSAKSLAPLASRFRELLERQPAIGRMVRDPESTWRRQLGTLGGGNHFIEICLDEADQVWVMLHSGSRGLGNAIGRHFIALAKRDIEGAQVVLPHRDLAYLREGTPHFDDYVAALGWAQDYALANRRELMRLVIAALRRMLPEFRVTDEAVGCHHNYVAIENHFGARLYVTRKGAIRAGRGELGIVPGSMGARSYIVRGKGAAESFCSSAHGAGRRMSRTEARRRFDRADLEMQTRGVECRKDKGVIDEIPAAYKDIDTVMDNQSDLVEVVHTLRQIVCVKG